MPTSVKMTLSDREWLRCDPHPSKSPRLDDSFVNVTMLCGSEITITEKFAEHVLEILRVDRAHRKISIQNNRMVSHEARTKLTSEFLACMWNAGYKDIEIEAGEVRAAPSQKVDHNALVIRICEMGIVSSGKAISTKDYDCCPIDWFSLDVGRYGTTSRPIKTKPKRRKTKK